MSQKVSQMPRKATTMDERDTPVPDVAPEADPNEPVILRVPIEQQGVDAQTDQIVWLTPREPVQEDRGQEVDLDEYLASRRAQNGTAASRQKPQGSNASAEADSSHGEQEERRRSWPAPREELEALVRQGLSNAEIAELYGVRRTTVQARLYYLGIKRDGRTWARLKSMGGQKGGTTTGRRYRELVGAPQEDGGDAAKADAPAPAKEAAAVEEFARYLARAVLQARAMGLDVEIRLRAGGAA